MSLHVAGTFRRKSLPTAVHSFLQKQDHAAVHLPDSSCLVHTLELSCDLCLPFFQSIIVPIVLSAIVEANPVLPPITSINIKPLDKGFSRVLHLLPI